MKHSFKWLRLARPVFPLCISVSGKQKVKCHLTKRSATLCSRHCNNKAVDPIACCGCGRATKCLCKYQVKFYPECLISILLGVISLIVAYACAYQTQDIETLCLKRTKWTQRTTNDMPKGGRQVYISVPFIKRTRTARRMYHNHVLNVPSAHMVSTLNVCF